jgi:hypothetical protein
MRFREYADQPRPTSDPYDADLFQEGIPAAGHERWLADDRTVDGPPEAPRAAVFGELRTAGFRDAFCVLADDDGKLEYQVERGAGTVEVARDLGLLATFALDRLIEDPDSRLHNGLFRAAVWAACTTPAGAETTDLLWTARYDSTSPEPAGPDLARLLPGDRRLARALARMLASPVDLAARRAFEESADLAAVLAGIEPVRLDLTRTKLTAAGITGALLGDTDMSHGLAVAEIAVTGTWPADGPPPVQPVEIGWRGLTWRLLDAQPAGRAW